MTASPIVGRELRVAARRWTTYWKRTWFALVAIIVGVFVCIDQWTTPSYSLSSDLFGTFVFLAIWFCLGFGLFSTADCLSSEKRQGTLGLLFLTDLKGYDVVLGKLATNSIPGFYATLALCPIMAVPLLLGGVTVGEFWRAVLLLPNTLLFSLAAGMLVSTYSLSPRKAMGCTLALLLFFVALLPAAAGLILLFTPSHRSLVAEVLLWPCPFFGLAQVSDAAYRAARHHEYWWSLGMIHGLAWFFLCWASRAVRNCWQDRPADARTQRWREWKRNWVYGNAGVRKTLRARLLSVNAMFWLAGRAWSKPAWVWAVLGLVAGLWAWGCWWLGSEWFNEGIYFLTAILLNSILKIWIGSEAGRQLGEDRHSGALELVLSTSFGVKDILRGQLLALRRQFLAPLVVVIAVQGIFLAASLQRESFHDQPINPVLWLAGVFMLVADILALTWGAMWAALTTKTTVFITPLTLGRILVAPWVLFIAILIVADLYVNSNEAFTWEYYVGLWFLLGLLTDLGFGLATAWQLHTRFRTLALQHLAPTSSLRARWARWRSKFSSGRRRAPVVVPDQGACS